MSKQTKDDSLKLLRPEIQTGGRDGVPIEKGATITEEFVNTNFREIGNICSLFTVYPDIYLDLITPEDTNFKLYFFQRIMLRSFMRYKDIYITACRGFSKSFMTILGLFLQCVFFPGGRRFICAPYKEQAARIAKEKIIEIYRIWPLLRKEVIGGEFDEEPGNFGKDYVQLKFRNGSVLDVVGALDSARGGRRMG